MLQDKVFNLRSRQISLYKEVKPHSVDLAIVLLLAIAIGIVSFLSAQQIPDAILTDFYALDVWFGSDIPNVFGNMTSLLSEFGRNNKHPLFPIIAFPFVLILRVLFNLSAVTATRLATAIVASLCIASAYWLFRLMKCQRLDATLFSILFGVSAASTFWFVIPESFSFGALTILIGLVFTALTQYYKLSPLWHVAIGVITVSVTVTNWMVGIFATLVNFRWKKALQIFVVTFIVTNVIWVFQRVVFVNTGFTFQPSTFLGEKEFIAELEHGSILGAIVSFFYQTMIMPAVQFGTFAIRSEWPKTNVEMMSLITRANVWELLAVASWTALLILGGWAFFTHKRNHKLRVVLGLTILGQLLMHSIYGAELKETFIYSLHFAPILVVLVSFSVLTRWRLVALALTSILILSSAINNRAQFNYVTDTLQYYGTPQQQVISQMKNRPSDPWSQSVGHVVLSTPGSDKENKAYHEPGGNFSPVPGSFGVSIWTVDQNGTIQTTSDTIPLDQIQQSFAYTPGQATPTVITQTNAYQASWSAPQSGTWKLDLKPASSSLKTVVVIRSVGPAGSAITDLNWNGQRLLINKRWSVKPPATVAKVSLGSETTSGWMREQSTLTQWQDEKGWGYARIELSNNNPATILVEDSVAVPTSPLNATGVTANLTLELPDRTFADSLNAQIAHIMMGLTGEQTRPSDPINYPLPRLRDGAYQLVALARTGQLDTAKQLATYFAETDFLNGIEPEADIPALGVWALTTVADQVNQPDYDQWAWTHVRRKVGLIVEMLSTNRSGYPIAKGSQFPLSEHPDFVRVDLYGGRVINSPNLISVDLSASMMSYRALLDAAKLADRLNQPQDAQAWRSQAEQVRSAWQTAFKQSFEELDRTYTTSLWPSWIAASDEGAFATSLEARWNETYDEQGSPREMPENTFLNLAELHQWLLLGQSDRVWSTLKWFWNHQASPGLYTWWGQIDDPDSILTPKNLSQWSRFRGWVNPPHVTPHYWASSEMALLQLDMLAYSDPTQTKPTLVIGAGIPKDWIGQPMSVKGLQLDGRLVNWAWDGKQVTVELQGQNIEIKLGQAFPANTPVKVIAGKPPVSTSQPT